MFYTRGEGLMSPQFPTIVLRAQSDDKLARLVASGNERAFEAIVDRYRQPLLRYVTRIIGDSRADDVVQAAFVSAWDEARRGRGRPRSQGLALPDHPERHAQRDEARAARATCRCSPDNPMSTGDDSQSEVEQREAVREMLGEIAALPEQERRAFLAVAVDGRRHRDVGDELGVSEGAVRMLIHRARSSVRAAAAAFSRGPLIAWFKGLFGGCRRAAARPRTPARAARRRQHRRCRLARRQRRQDRRHRRDQRRSSTAGGPPAVTSRSSRTSCAPAGRRVRAKVPRRRRPPRAPTATPARRTQRSRPAAAVPATGSVINSTGAAPLSDCQPRQCAEPAPRLPHPPDRPGARTEQQLHRLDPAPPRIRASSRPRRTTTTGSSSRRTRRTTQPVNVTSRPTACRTTQASSSTCRRPARTRPSPRPGHTPAPAAAIPATPRRSTVRPLRPPPPSADAPATPTP